MSIFSLYIFYLSGSSLFLHCLGDLAWDAIFFFTHLQFAGEELDDLGLLIALSVMAHCDIAEDELLPEVLLVIEGFILFIFLVSKLDGRVVRIGDDVWELEVAFFQTPIFHELTVELEDAREVGREVYHFATSVLESFEKGGCGEFEFFNEDDWNGEAGLTLVDLAIVDKLKIGLN